MFCEVNRTCWCPWCGCPVCGCEGEALKGIAGFCLRSGRLRAEQVLWAGQLISEAHSGGIWSREVGLQIDLKTGWMYPGFG